MNMVRSVLCAVLAFSLGQAAQAAVPLKIAYVSGSARSKIGALILVEIYKKANMEVVAQPYPGARSTFVAEHSEVVGEAVRVGGYTESHPTLTMVEPAITSGNMVAFYRAELDPHIRSAEDLKKFRVGYVRGTRSAENILSAQALRNVEFANSTELLFKMLLANRFDVALEGGSSGDLVIRKNACKGIAQTLIARISLFHVLSPKYKYLAPQLSSIIKQMSSSGELKKLQTRIEKSVMDDDTVH